MKILDTSSKWRSFFNEAKLKGGNKSNCFSLNYDNTGPSQREKKKKKKLSAVREKIPLRIYSDHTFGQVL